MVNNIILILLKRFMTRSNLVNVWHEDILSITNNNNRISSSSSSNNRNNSSVRDDDDYHDRHDDTNELMIYHSLHLLHHYRLIWNYYQTSTISLFHSHQYIVLMMKAIISIISSTKPSLSSSSSSSSSSLNSNNHLHHLNNLQQLLSNIQHILKKISRNELYNSDDDM